MSDLWSTFESTLVRVYCRVLEIMSIPITTFIHHLHLYSTVAIRAPCTCTVCSSDYKKTEL